MSQPFRRLTADAAAEFIKQDGVRILDCRDARAYDASHIDGAERLDDRSFGGYLSQLKRDTPVFIYCYHGNASQTYAGMFADFRFTNVHDLVGGYEAWEQYERASRKPAPGPIPADLADWLEAQGFPRDDINALIENKTTPLMRAARLGDAAMTAAIVAAGADLELRNADGNNALWLACFANDPATIDVLVGAGVDVDNQNDNGATCLMYAASAGKTAAVVQLLKAGADVLLKSADDYTALDMVANEECLYLLRAVEKSLKAQQKAA
ncbi:rhodanese-like domain-containing protein [Derxia gummosa]|uniref:Rhodanese-like domain-containing protein n=1 Tax=Derxia gummosa DSM 723 TaxID=1121388 RepID=A0A8B6X1B2_9BURK|nr:rhodanese-like domain-containing protein [Derxia gummosa]